MTAETTVAARETGNAADHLFCRRAEAASADQAESPELLTVPTAARRAGIGVRQLRRAITSGEVPHYQVGSWPRVRWREVVQWINAQRVRITRHAERRVAEVLAREEKGLSRPTRGN